MLLTDSKAQKLLGLSSPQTPLEVIVLAVVRGVLDLQVDDDSDVILTAIEKLIDGGRVSVCCHV